MGAALFCLLGRALHVYPFSWALNRCSGSHDLSIREQHMVWYAGLRGGIALMCALGFPRSKSGVDHRSLIISITVLLTVASLLFFGWATKWLLRCLGIKARDDLSSTVQGTFQNHDSRSSWMAQRMQQVLMSSDAIAERNTNNQKSNTRWMQRHAKAHASARGGFALHQPSRGGSSPGSGFASVCSGAVSMEPKSKLAMLAPTLI